MICRLTEKKERKEAAILDAALSLFAERGFHGTAMPEVARRARVGTGTIYRYFASKEALVNALYRKLKLDMSQHILGAFPFEKPLREQFRYFWRAQIEYARANPRAFAFLELHYHRPYLDKQSQATEERMIAVIAEFFEKARREDLVKDLPMLLLFAMVWGALVAVVRAAEEGYIPDLDRHIDDAEQAAWDAIAR